jgi:hypothetical protein
MAHSDNIGNFKNRDHGLPCKCLHFDQVYSGVPRPSLTHMVVGVIPLRT